MSTPEKVCSILNFYQQVVDSKELPKDMAKIRELAAFLKEMNFENLEWGDAIQWQFATEQTKGIADPDEKIVRLVSEVFWDKRALAMHYLGPDIWSKENPQRAAAAAKVIDFFIDPAKSENCLDLHGLGLTDADIPPCLQNLPDFKVVDLSGNCLTKIPEFPGSQKVEILNLNGNNIQEIPDSMEQRFPNLTTLKLDQNPLDVARIPVSIFKHSKLQQLKFFNLDFNANSLRTVAKILPGYDTCLRDLFKVLSGMDELQKKYIFAAIEGNLPAKTHEVIKHMQGYNNALVAACLFHPNVNVPLEKVEQLDEAFNKSNLSLFDFPLEGVALKNAVERAIEFIPYIQERWNIDRIKDIIKTLFVEEYIADFYDNPFVEHLSNEELRIIANKQILYQRDTWLNASRLSRESLLYYVQHFMSRVMYQIGHNLKDKNIDPQGAAELLFPILGQLHLEDINYLIDYMDFELFKIFKAQLQAVENLQDRVDLFSKTVDILPYLGDSLEAFQRARELLPHIQLLQDDKKLFGAIVKCLFNTEPEDVSHFHHNFTKSIPFLLKLKAEELIALLNVTDGNGYSLRQDFHRIVPVIEQLPAGLAATLIPLGLTLEDFKRTKMAEDWCFFVDKFDPKYSAEISSEAYLTRSQALSAKLLTLWDSLQFSPSNVNEEGKVPHLFLEVDGRFATPQDIRNTLVEMFNKLQNKTEWAGVPHDSNARELFYKEMLITFEEVAEALEKTEDVSLVAGTLISIATPAIQGRCGTAYIDELKQKAEYINPVSVPKDYKSRYQISANKALFAMITNLGVMFWESNVHVLRHLKYVCRLGLSPDVGVLNDETAQALIRENFDLERFLKDIGHDFSDQMCDLYFEETMPHTFNPELSNLLAKFKGEEMDLFRSFRIDPKLLEKLAAMRTTLRHIPINEAASASTANLIELAEGKISGLLPDLKVAVKAELDAFKANRSVENLENLKNAITQYGDSRRRSYLKKREPQPSVENSAIEQFKKSLEGIRSFELEMQPHQLGDNDLLEALKVRIALENGLMDLGKNLPDDITYSMQEHGTPSEAIRQERLLQYKIDKLGEHFNYYRKLLYIAKEEKILVKEV